MLNTLKDDKGEVLSDKNSVIGVYLWQRKRDE